MGPEWMDSTARENLVVGVPDLGPTDLTASTPAGEAALVVIRTPVATLLALEPAVRKGDDPEAIHDMRVAARRIRTALRVFADVVPGWADGLRTELRWLAKALGHVRDLDVQRGWLATAASEPLGGEDLDALAALEEALVARRDPAHAEIVEALDSTRFDRIRIDMTALARGPALASEEASRPIALLAPAIVTSRYRAMRRAGKPLGADSPAQKLHTLRIRCKRARYALEFVRPLYGKPADSLVRRLVALQDLLGDLHDADIAGQRLRDVAEGPDGELPAKAAFVLGRLSERSARRARKLRRRFPDTYRAASGRRWKELKRTMHGEAD